MVKLRAMAALLAAAATAGAPAAQAHPEMVPTLVNRYLTFTPSGARLGIDVAFLFGALPASERRRTIDRDGDGRLSERELADERTAWEKDAPTQVQLTLDGRPLTMPFAARIDLGGKDGTGSDPLVIELSAVITLDPGEHRLAASFGPDLPRMGESEIVFSAVDPWRVRATLDTAGGSLGGDGLIRFASPRVRPDEPRAGTYIIRSEGPVLAARPHAAVPIVLIVLATALGIALTLLVRRMDRARVAKK